jgi:2-dehydropantoate 2-reductase
MKILVMGTGAVGAYFGARLQAAGEDVVFCARGENLHALQQRGLEVESYRGALKLQVTATDQPAQFAPYDLILFAVKVYDTERAAERIKQCLKPNGVIMTLQNGIEGEQRLCKIFGRQSVMAGNARVGVELVAPGKVVHSTTGTIEFGELDGAITERAKAIAAAFERAGILGELTSQLPKKRWEKLMWNATFNTVTTLTRRRVGEVLADPDGQALVRALMAEVQSAARAEGVELSDESVEQLYAHSAANLAPLKTSTLQDLERGKRLEYDALTGAVVRVARRHGLKTPAIETVHALIKLLDEGTRARP